MMRRYRAVSVVAVALLAHGPAVVGADGTLPTEAVKAIDANDWRAVEKILKPLAKEPGGEAINYWLGFARYSRNDKDARWALLGALAARPTSIANARMVARCGQLFAADHRLPKFIAATADTYSFDADVQHFVGMTWAKRYLYDLKIQSRIVKRDPGQSLGNAIFHLERAHELGTTRPSNARWLAFLLYRKGRFAGAAEHARRAIAAGDVGYEIYIVLGASLTRLSRPKEAEAAYEQARRLAPAKAGMVEYERGRAFLRNGHYNESVDALRRVVHLDFPQPNARNMLGVAALAGKNYPFALWSFRQSHLVDNRTDDIYYQGRCAYAMGYYADAERLFARAIAKYGEHRRDKTPPNAWAHYLGRAQWHQGKRDEGLKNLKAAFDRSQAYRLYATWLFRAQLAAGDLHGAIQTARLHGRKGRYDESIAAIEKILVKWPRPRAQDFFAKKIPHLIAAYTSLGELHWETGRYRTAAYYYGKGRRTRGRMASSRAGWAFVHTGELDRAEAVFREYIRTRKGQQKDYGRVGLGCVLLAKGKGAEAEQVWQAVTRKFSQPGRSVGLFWAALGRKDAPAGKQANAYTALGMIRRNKYGTNRGERIYFIIPGSPLAAARPKVQVDDRVISVGEMYLGTDQQQGRFAAAKIPAEPVEAVIKRGKHEFTVKLDFRPILKRLPRPPGGQAGEKEVRP